jgi:hypothetical protein
MGDRRLIGERHMPDDDRVSAVRFILAQPIGGVPKGAAR